MLQKFLDAKPLYYDEIDYERMPNIYKKIKDSLKLPKIIHLIGTNGKGTTGRFLASALYTKGFHTGHYTSPHIVNFNERIWIDNSNITDEKLEIGHKKLLTLLSKDDADSLSYFEYTTLLAMVMFEGLEYVVLEAGLGGEYDATAVFEKTLTLVTPIGIDHEAFLGDTLHQIATTKLNAIQNIAILAEQPNKELYSIAQNIEQKNGLKIFKVEEFLKSDDYLKIDTISQNLSLAPYLTQNLKLAISALKFLEIEYDIADFKDSKLFGRLTPLHENILLDVGHNILASQAIVNSCKDEKYILVYNSYKDKNYKEILTILKPILKWVEIIEIKDDRIEKKALLSKTVVDLGLDVNNFTKIVKDEKYLVFGSFKVVEEFLKIYNG